MGEAEASRADAGGLLRGLTDPERTAPPSLQESRVQVAAIIERERAPEEADSHLDSGRAQGPPRESIAVAGRDHPVARLARQPVLDRPTAERIVEGDGGIPPGRVWPRAEVADHQFALLGVGAFPLRSHSTFSGSAHGSDVVSVKTSGRFPISSSV